MGSEKGSEIGWGGHEASDNTGGVGRGHSQVGQEDSPGPVPGQWYQCRSTHPALCSLHPAGPSPE